MSVAESSGKLTIYLWRSKKQNVKENETYTYNSCNIIYWI